MYCVPCEYTSLGKPNSVVPEICLKIEIKLSQNDNFVCVEICRDNKLRIFSYCTYAETKDMATGRLFIDFPPKIYSEVLFCLCVEKNA